MGARLRERRGGELERERERERLHVLEIHNNRQCKLTWSVGAAMRAGTCGERRVKEG